MFGVRCVKVRLASVKKKWGYRNIPFLLRACPALKHKPISIVNICPNVHCNIVVSTSTPVLKMRLPEGA